MGDAARVAGGATLGSLLRDARRKLAGAGVESADLDARLIIEHLTATDRIEAIRSPDQVVAEDKVRAVGAALERRIAGEPVHRILGYREFYGRRFHLSAETLEPRPDTEILVDLVLPFVRERAEALGRCRILDLGTGSGAIALSLLAEVGKAFAVGVDISAGALAAAAGNADILGVADRFEISRSDWFSDVAGKFDLIVSNPPYIATGEMQDLSREVRQHDPRAALDGGNDGLEAYRAIAGGAQAHLAESGQIALEIGHTQKQAVTELFGRAGYRLLSAAKDLAGNDRALAFRR